MKTVKLFVFDQTQFRGRRFEIALEYYAIKNWLLLEDKIFRDFSPIYLKICKVRSKVRESANSP